MKSPAAATVLMLNLKAGWVPSGELVNSNFIKLFWVKESPNSAPPTPDVNLLKYIIESPLNGLTIASIVQAVLTESRFSCVVCLTLLPSLCTSTPKKLFLVVDTTPPKGFFISKAVVNPDTLGVWLPNKVVPVYAELAEAPFMAPVMEVLESLTCILKVWGLMPDWNRSLRVFISLTTSVVYPADEELSRAVAATAPPYAIKSLSALYK